MNYAYVILAWAKYSDGSKSAASAVIVDDEHAVAHALQRLQAQGYSGKACPVYADDVETYGELIVITEFLRMMNEDPNAINIVHKDKTGKQLIQLRRK